jgi:uncharacterized protein YndB with AHSA1/START domain
MSFQKVNISASVSADLKTTWDCYTNPKHIVNWNFASDDWHCPNASNDLRVGGKFVSRMEAKDGSFGFDFEGDYTEVVDLAKIVYAMSDGRTATVNFKENGDSTHVDVVFDAEGENSIDMQRDGWQAILNNFKTYTESKLSSNHTD